MLEVNGNHGGDTFGSALNEYLDVPIATKEGPTPLRILAAQAMQHEYMQYMHQQPRRLASFKYNANDKFKDFGENIDSALHGVYVMRIAAAITKYGRMDGGKIEADPQEIALGLLANLVHDGGEFMHPEIKRKLGYVLGDVPHGKKTAEHRVMEDNVFFYAMPRVFPSLPDGTIQWMHDLVSHKDKDLGPWQTYFSGHKEGEVAPAIAASHKLMVAQSEGLIHPKTPRHTMRRFATYALLSNEVIKTHLPDFKEWANEFNLINYIVNEEYGEMIKWHEETGGFQIIKNEAENIEDVVVPEGYEKVLEKSNINLPRSIGNLAVFGYDCHLPTLAA